MEDICYQEFTSNDYNEAFKLWKRTDGMNLYENGEDNYEEITSFLERNPGLSFIAKHNNKIVGTLLCGHDGRRGNIYHLAVDKHF